MSTCACPEPAVEMTAATFAPADAYEAEAVAHPEHAEQYRAWADLCRLVADEMERRAGQ